MLRQLGFTKIRLMTNNPDKLAALSHYGIAIVEQVPLAFPSNAHNEAYLRTKAMRSGHLLDPSPARSRCRHEAERPSGGTGTVASRPV